MGQKWQEEYLDFVLVPSGLLIMLGYHLLHLHRCVKLPLTTVIGYENYNRKAWVERILQLEPKDRGQAIPVLGANISAATSLASISLTLSSLIGAWIGSSYHNNNIANTTYGNTSPTVIYIKYIALLSCFMIAFACFVQTIRCFVHANFLITMPNCEMPVSIVESAVVRGSNFWVVGMRALYFATNLILWIFGPIPMFVSSVITVVVLQYIDKNSNAVAPFNAPTNDSLKKADKEMTTLTCGTAEDPKASDKSPKGSLMPNDVLGNKSQAAFDLNLKHIEIL